MEVLRKLIEAKCEEQTDFNAYNEFENKFEPAELKLLSSLYFYNLDFIVNDLGLKPVGEEES